MVAGDCSQEFSCHQGDRVKKLSEGKRGLALADPETVQRVAKAGGYATHKTRGLQGASKKVRAQVARLGGLARLERCCLDRSSPVK